MSCAETGVPPAALIFEVTETAAVANIQVAREFAERLSNLGCRFALDDFGAGFDSFYYLKYLPFDFLKIDGEFVVNCTRNRTDQLVIESLVSVARGSASGRSPSSCRTRRRLRSCAPAASIWRRVTTSAVRCRSTSCWLHWGFPERPARRPASRPRC